MSRYRVVAATAMMTAGAVAAAVLPAGGASAEGGQNQLAEVRQATKQFHDVQVAIEAGYQPAEDCVPGMGFHYINWGLLSDPTVDALAPEVLLYAPSGNGGVKLVGVEWVKMDTDQNPGTEESIYVVGQKLKGPMTHPGVPWHYDLHAYIWQGNPDGVFNDTNRNITC